MKMAQDKYFVTEKFPEEGLEFSGQIIGPAPFHVLRDCDYGNGFRMATMPELALLMGSCLGNYDSVTGQHLKWAMEKGLTADVGILYTVNGMYVQDHPSIKEGIMKMSKEETLEKRLGSHEEKGVIFSDDGSVRFAPYNFQIDHGIGARGLGGHLAFIALCGGQEKAKNLGEGLPYGHPVNFFMAHGMAPSIRHHKGLSTYSVSSFPEPQEHWTAKEYRSESKESIVSFNYSNHGYTYVWARGLENSSSQYTFLVRDKK